MVMTQEIKDMTDKIANNVLGNMKILNDILNERIRQEDLKANGKFTFTCADLDESYAEKLAVLSEEVGEVAREVIEHTITDRKYAADKALSFGIDGVSMPPHRQEYFRDRIRKELIQVAAVCVAWCEALDKDKAISDNKHASDGREDVIK